MYGGNGIICERQEAVRKLYVRIDFMLVTGIRLQDDLPDTTTFCRFRNRMIELSVEKSLFSVDQSPA